MKLIDLLVKIANNEEVPKKIKFEGEIFVFDKNYRRYVDENDKLLGERTCLDAWLNDEIEIIEERPKKIEYVQHSSNDSQNVKKIKSKIDELVDAVNYLLEKESDK